METVMDTEAWHRIFAVKGGIFKVTFRTKTPVYGRLPDGRRAGIIRPAGSVRTMICRRLVHKYTLGVISPEARLDEDVRNNVLTVWDVQFFNNLRTHLEDQGMSRELANITAGRRSYRRINMADIIEIQGA